MSILRSLHTRVDNLINGSITKNIVFVHVPKCGGNSIASAIYDRYKTFSPRGNRGLVNIDAGASLEAARTFYGSDPFDDDYNDVLRCRELILGYFLNVKGTRLISGHISFNELFYQESKSIFEYVTMLRDPVKRWISAYFYNKYRDEGVWKIGDDIYDYFETRRARANGYEYVKKFIGRRGVDVDYTASEAITAAKNSLEKFAVVGVLEDIEGFNTNFKKTFDVDLRIGKKNTGPKSSDFVKSAITREIEERIRELCQPDLAVYQYVVDNLSGAIGKQRSE